MLRRLNTRHKSPQLVALQCFVASFWSMFHVFHLAWSTCHATKTFVAGWRNAARWLVDLFGEDPREVASLVKNQQQRQNFTLFFTTAFFNRQQKYLLRDNLITQGEKRETWTQNLQRNKLRVFLSRSSPPLTLSLPRGSSLTSKIVWR